MGSTLLKADGIGNLLLGVVFLLFPGWVSEVLGVPQADDRFYPTVLGSLLLGIGIALLIEHFRGTLRLGGLGLAGALCINLCFGFALALWFVTTDVEPTATGTVLLWGLFVILVGLSGAELISEVRACADAGADAR